MKCKWYSGKGAAGLWMLWMSTGTSSPRFLIFPFSRKFPFPPETKLCKTAAVNSKFNAQNFKLWLIHTNCSKMYLDFEWWCDKFHQLLGNFETCRRTKSSIRRSQPSWIAAEQSLGEIVFRENSTFRPRKTNCDENIRHSSVAAVIACAYVSKLFNIDWYQCFMSTFNITCFMRTVSILFFFFYFLFQNNGQSRINCLVTCHVSWAKILAPTEKSISICWHYSIGKINTRKMLIVWHSTSLLGTSIFIQWTNERCEACGV